ncbi:MAG: outer membrane beta-barrel protein [Bacteroidota bacterium]|nr:outer membrane beta-barrel protein [Bacteroidota bacterium]
MSNKFFPALFTLFFIFTTKGGNSQNLTLGLRGGLGLPNLSSSGGSDISKGYKTISGPDFGFVMNCSVARQVDIETGIEWSTQGGQKSGLQTIPASNELLQYFPPGSNIQYLYASFKSTVRLQYLMVPVLLKYMVNLDQADHWKLYWDGGLFGALLMTAKASAMGASKVYYDPGETNPVGPVAIRFDSAGDIKNQLHRGNFGMEGNVGILYHTDFLSVFAEGGANYGFINLQKNSQNGVNHTGALIFRIGVLFNPKAGNFH